MITFQTSVVIERSVEEFAIRTTAGPTGGFGECRLVGAWRRG